MTPETRSAPSKAGLLLRHLAAFLLLLAAAPGWTADDVRAAPSCSLCRMSREKFDYGRVLLKFRDGTSVATCSVTCAAVELARKGEDELTSFLVADYRTKELIDGRTAFWVVGGVRRGIMTNVPKWAFGSEAAAQAFIDEYGGSRATFEEVLAAAAADTKTKLKLGTPKKRSD